MSTQAVHCSDVAPTTKTIAAAPSLPGLLLVLALNLLLISLFYNKGWIPSDDGHYVHVADRIVQGQVLNRDVEELHPGYIHFINAVALHLFGDRIVSLRFPLMVLMLFQSLLAYEFFRRHTSTGVAATAGFTLSAIGILQVANPTTSLYALGAIVALATALTLMKAGTRRRLVAAGFLVGTVFMFRQLTGAFMAMAVISILLTERREPISNEVLDIVTSTLLSRLLLAITLIGLLLYLFHAATPSSFVLFGAGPVAILLWALIRTAASNYQTVQLMGYSTIGGLLSAMPLVIYHITHGSVIPWLRDVLVRALSITDLPHLANADFMQNMLIPAAVNIYNGTTLERLNGFYWVTLLLSTVLVAVHLMLRLRWRPSDRPADASGGYNELVLPIIAVFGGLIPVFNQIPYYLYQHVGLSLGALLWLQFAPTTEMSNHWQLARRRLMQCAIVIVGITGVWSHAGQPYARTMSSLVAGDRYELQMSSLPRMGLWIDPTEDKRYSELVGTIEKLTPPEAIIFAAPNSAELYYLSNRTNAFRLFNPTISLISDQEAHEFIERFKAVNPTMILHDESSVYNTRRTLEVMEAVLGAYTEVDQIGPYKVYLGSE